MRFNKILLLYPQYPGSHYNGSLLPVGLGIIAEMLKLDGIDYEVVDLGLGYDSDYLLQKIKKYRPDAVGISMMTFRYKHLYSTLEMLKGFQKEIKIIAGGPHVTAWKEKVLEQCPAIDFGVSREGEFTIRELCQGKELSAIKGLIYREGDNIVFNGERELIDNLDIIPFPKYEKFEMDKYGPTIWINSARGCPYKCIFCQSCSILGKKWRARSAANVADELTYWRNRGYRRFSFVDDNFNLDTNRVYRLCDEISSRGLGDISLHCAGVRADRVNQELLKRMKEAGFTYLSFGVESASNKVLHALKKRITIEQIDMAVSCAIDAGIDVGMYFMIGSPYETLEDVQASLDFAMKYPIRDALFSNLVPIPDTELITWIEKHGRLFSAPEKYLNDYPELHKTPLFVAPGMSIEERRIALDCAEKAQKTITERATRVRIKKETGLRFKKYGGLAKPLAAFYVSGLGQKLREVGRPIYYRIKHAIGQEV